MRRHETDVTSLVFGLVFLGLAGLWALVQGKVLSLPDASVVGPALLVGAGVVGLVVTLSGSARSRRRTQQTERTAVLEEPAPDERP